MVLSSLLLIHVSIPVISSIGAFFSFLVWSSLCVIEAVFHCWALVGEMLVKILSCSSLADIIALKKMIWFNYHRYKIWWLESFEVPGILWYQKFKHPLISYSSLTVFDTAHLCSFLFLFIAIPVSSISSKPMILLFFLAAQFPPLSLLRINQSIRYYCRTRRHGSIRLLLSNGCIFNEKKFFWV